MKIRDRNIVRGLKNNGKGQDEYRLEVKSAHPAQNINI
jgi:hypothetical protein